MILGLFTILGTIFGATSGAIDLANFVHEHPFSVGQLAPGSDEWDRACANAFKSWDPDHHWWIDRSGKHQPCVCNKAGQCGSHWGKK